MIQISNTAIMIMKDDATRVPFESEEIQTRIIQACLSSGETSSWIAMDIALAVECALLSNRTRVIRENELDELVVRALEDSGYPHVAADFKRSASSMQTVSIPVTENEIRRVLETNLAVPEDRLNMIADHVEQALDAIGFGTVSPKLILELGREFRNSFGADQAFPDIQIKTNPLKAGDESMLLKPRDFHDMGSVNLRDLLSGGSLRIFGVSRLFPAIRLEISFPAFADAMELSRPVSELALQSSWGRLIAGIDEVCSRADHYCSAEEIPVTLPLPLCLTFRGTVLFAEQYMNCRSSNSVDFSRSLIADFAASLSRKPFKITDRT